MSVVIEDAKVTKFPGGICLLGVGWAQFGADVGDGEFINEDIKVKVPPKTEFVDVSLLSANLVHGKLAARTPSPIAAITVDITIASAGGKPTIDASGYCSINLKAALQDKATIGESGAWGGKFTMQIKCFGKP